MTDRDAREERRRPDSDQVAAMEEWVLCLLAEKRELERALEAARSTSAGCPGKNTWATCA